MSSSASSSERFPSLSALRAEHSTLLQIHRNGGDAPDILDAIQQFIQQGKRTGALIDSEEDRTVAQGSLDYWSTILYRAGRPDADMLLDEFDPMLAPELPDDLCPFVGLNAFREQNGAIFFGRQRLIDVVLAKLQTERLVTVIGSSGSGKSSLVLAGVIPALKGGAIPATEATPSSQAWRYAPRMVPGSNPLANLARLLQTAGEATAEADKGQLWRAEQIERLLHQSDYLVQMVNATDPTPDKNAPVVLVVDQFEETFTLCTDEVVRVAFVRNLMALAQTPGLRHTVILTMRTDFEPQIARLPDFQARFENALVRVTPLSSAELRQAIEQPATLIGLKFESGLIEQLLQDVLGEPAALPLLQFTLLKLWENRDRNRITWEAYKRLGGGRLALARSADELFASLIPEEQVTARRILLRLVRPSEGLEVTSNRVRLATLYQSGEARDRIDRVLQKLLNAHLLRISEGDTAADTQIEVAHEALVRNWPRLVAWLDQERAAILERLRLTEAAEQWVKVGRDPGALWRGALLDEAQDYVDLDELEIEFMEASRAAEQIAAQEKEAVRQRELDQIRALAAEQKLRADIERQRAEQQSQAAASSRRLATWLASISVVAIMFALATTWFSMAANSERSAAQAANAEAALQVATANAASTRAIQEAATADVAQNQEMRQATVVSIARATATQQVIAAQTAIAQAEQESEHNKNALDYLIQTLREVLDEVSPRATPSPGPSPTGILTGTVGAAGAPANRPIPSQDNTAATPIAPAVEALEDVQRLPSEPLTQTYIMTEPLTAALTASENITNFGRDQLDAILPAVEVDLLESPQNDARVLQSVRGPMRMAVLQLTESTNWIEVTLSDGLTGWIPAWMVTYEGDTKLLPIELRYLAVSNQEDVPFSEGRVIDWGGAQGDFLLSDPNNEQSGILWVPSGTELTLLFNVKGSASYGSGVWYFVTLVDPNGENHIWRGYLPQEVIEEKK